MSGLPSDISTQITNGQKEKISHLSLSYKSPTTNMRTKEKIIVPTDYILTGYTGILQDYITTKTFTTEELMSYKFKPKLFCLDTYGTIELWSSILRINSMVSATDFNKQTIKIYTNDILEVINKILIAEKQTISDNTKYIS